MGFSLGSGTTGPASPGAQSAQDLTKAIPQPVETPPPSFKVKSSLSLFLSTSLSLWFFLGV